MNQGPAGPRYRPPGAVARGERGQAVLRGELAGRYRIRTGDYRLQFRVEGDEVIIERMGHRDRFYE